MGFKFQNELFFKLLLNFQVGKVAGTTYYRNFFPSKGYCDMDMHQLVDIFCEVDDFCNELDKHCQNYMLSGPTKSNRGPTCGLSISEIMTILVMFQMSGFRDFKNFYMGFLSFYHKSYFPNLPCYGRFVSLISRAIFPLTIFTQLKGWKTNRYLLY